MALSLEDFTGFEKLGAGGMGEVYCATQISLKRKVVLKKIATGLHLDEGILEKFENEALSAAALDHNHIVHIYDFGENNGELFLVMEYVDGPDFGKLLIEDRFPRLLGLMIAMQALKGLNCAHKKGITHGDFKPNNILVSKTGMVKVTDFGLARRDSEVVHNSPGLHRFITPAYMPPEVARRVLNINLSVNALSETTPITTRMDIPEDAIESDGKTIAGDIWAAGVLLYRILCAEFPFSGENFSDLAESILHAQEPHVLKFAPFLSNDLSDRLGSCLIKDPKYRLSDLEPLIESLGFFFSGIGIRDFEKEIRNYMTDKNAAAGELEKTLLLYQSRMAGESTESGYSLDAAAPGNQDEKKGKHGKISIGSTVPDQFEKEGDKPQWSRSSRTASLVIKIITAFIAVAVVSVITLQLLHVNIPGLIENYSNFRTPAMAAKQEAAPQPLPASSETTEAQPDALPQPPPASSETTEAQPDSLPQPPPASSETAATQTAIASSEASAAGPIRDAGSGRPGAVQAVNKAKKAGPPGNLRSARHAEKKAAQVPKKTREPEKAVAVSNEPGLGTLRINVRPISAQLLIDGEIVSAEELAQGKKVSPGPHVVTAWEEGFVLARNQVAVEAGSTHSLDIVLAPNVQGTGLLHVYTYPWSDLYIDGKYQGTTPTPQPLTLAEGKHTIVLRRDGFRPYSGMVLIQKSETTRLQFNLEKAGSSAP